MCVCNAFVRVCGQIPGPGAHKVVDLSIYKTRPPKYSMTMKHPPLGDRTQKPGPGSHYPEKVSLYPPRFYTLLYTPVVDEMCYACIIVPRP